MNHRTPACHVLDLRQFRLLLKLTFSVNQYPKEALLCKLHHDGATKNLLHCVLIAKRLSSHDDQEDGDSWRNERAKTKRFPVRSL